MSAKKIYTCDICDRTITRPELSFGIQFSQNDIFMLGGYGCTDGVHICFKCARQMKLQLNNDTISKMLD